MIFALLAALVIVNVLYVLHLERKDRRHDEQVGRLLMHIQAPEMAVAQRQVETAAPDLPAVHPDLDEDYWEAQEEALKKVREMEAGDA